MIEFGMFVCLTSRAPDDWRAILRGLGFNWSRVMESGIADVSGDRRRLPSWAKAL